MIPLIDLKAQYNNNKDKINSEVLSVLESAHYIMGCKVKELEAKVSEYIGSKHSISCANGTDALVISLRACGIGVGDEVITTPFTFFATAESISNVGAKPVFVDVDRETYNIDVSQIENKITSKTKAIIPVHIFGQPSEMDEINRIAKKYGLYVIEDGCQAIGAEYKNKKIGTLGDICCFSFFPTKNLGCFGDGGIITTNNDKLAAIIKALRIHGSGSAGKKAYEEMNGRCEDELVNIGDENDSVYDKTKYFNYLIGVNSRLDEIQAAILLQKLPYLDKWNQQRIETASFYSNSLKDVNLLVTPKVLDCVKSVFHLYILQTSMRDKITTYLKEKGISTGIYYPIPLHLQKVYRNLGYKYGDLPNSEYLSERTFAIPIYPELTDDNKSYIVESILSFKE